MSLSLAFVVLMSLVAGSALAAPPQAQAVDGSGVRTALDQQRRPDQAVAAAPLPVITPDPGVEVMLGQVSTGAIYNYTAQLTGVEPATVGGEAHTIISRHTYSGDPIQKAGQFIGEHLQAFGLKVEYHVWGRSGIPSTYPNVIGERTGSTSPGDVYIIGAHLDDNPDSGAAPGADDNATGSVGTLVAADILSQYQCSNTVRFAFWTGEEQGLLGSAAYANRAKDAGEKIRGYLNLDMIGYNGGAPNEINLFARSTVTGSVDMMNLYADAVTAYGLNLVPVEYVDNILGNYSDNRSFWLVNYPAMFAHEDHYGDGTPYIHTPGDTLSSLDMDYYTDLVKASLAAFVHLSGCLPADPGNQAPTGHPQLLATPEDTRLDIVLAGSDPEGAPLSYSVVAGPSHGTLSGTGPNLAYEPAANYYGEDGFTFIVSDGARVSEPVAINISVSPVNDAPVANAQSVATRRDSALALSLTGSDVDGDPLTYSIVDPPVHGALSGTPPALTYTPGAGYVGPDSFSFTASDGSISSEPATVSISMRAAASTLYLSYIASGTGGGRAEHDKPGF